MTYAILKSSSGHNNIYFVQTPFNLNSKSLMGFPFQRKTLHGYTLETQHTFVLKDDLRQGDILITSFFNSKHFDNCILIDLRSLDVIRSLYFTHSFDYQSQADSLGAKSKNVDSVAPFLKKRLNGFNR